MVACAWRALLGTSARWMVWQHLCDARGRVAMWTRRRRASMRRLNRECARRSRALLAVSAWYRTHLGFQCPPATFATGAAWRIVMAPTEAAWAPPRGAVVSSGAGQGSGALLGAGAIGRRRPMSCSVLRQRIARGQMWQCQWCATLALPVRCSALREACKRRRARWVSIANVREAIEREPSLRAECILALTPV